MTSARDEEKYILYGGPDPTELLQDGSLGAMIVKELREHPDNVGLVSVVIFRHNCQLGFNYVFSYRLIQRVKFS